MTGQTVKSPAKGQAGEVDNGKSSRPTVNTMDLTLDQLDQASALVSEGSCGYMASIAYVGLKGTEHEVTLADAGKLTLRDVMIVDNDELPEGVADPTT